ncbi:MAG: SDR family NAD(P)-dependent oxidoreductase [Pseudomonadota bacterium]
MSTILLTGATSGLGHAAARLLLRDPGIRLVVGARDPDDPRLADLPRDRVDRHALDLAQLASVHRFASAVAAPLSAVALNAGIQVTGGLTRTGDGYETDLTVNHLAHAALIAALAPKLDPRAVIVTTGSGTHSPDDRLARLFGFRGGRPAPMAEMAAGVGDDGPQADRDRYATSKLAQTAWTLGMARRDPARRWLVFDPGLMPGTALARDRGAAERFVWTVILPRLRPLIRGISSADASAHGLVHLLTDRTVPSGSAIGHDDRPAILSAPARDPAFQDAVVTETTALLAG